MIMLSHEERAELRRLLLERFSLSELKDLSFDLGVDHETFQHDTLPDLSRELLRFCEQRGVMSCLLNEVRKRRPDDRNWLATLLAKLPPCYDGQKIQIIVAETMLERVQELLDALARELGIPAEAITIVAAAWGSTRLLLDLPATAMDFTRFKRIATLANGRYQVLSIEAFAFLPSLAKATWRLIATNYPPLSAGDTLYATISWPAAQDLLNGQEQVTTVPPSPSPSTHWLSRPDNQTQLLAISRELVGKLYPGETERLERLFPRYVELAQVGQVMTAREAQTAFGLGGGVDPMTLVILSVLITAVNVWIGQQNRQALTELTLRQETDRALLYRLLDDALKQNRIARDERERLRPLMAEAIAGELTDLYSPYERGLEKLKELVAPNLELATYEQQLRDNISAARRYGDTEERASKRSEIIERLNHFSLARLGTLFNNFCV
jgi:hypothetical protein